MFSSVWGCVYVHFHVGVYVCVASRVSDSVEKNRRQLQSVTDRIRLAQARVDKIKGSKKATKVTQHLHFGMQLYIAEPMIHNRVTIRWQNHWKQYFVLCLSVISSLFCVNRFSPVLSTRPQIDFGITHLSLLRLQTPPHKPAPDTGYRINFDPLMRRPCRWDKYIKMLIIQGINATVWNVTFQESHGFTNCCTTNVFKPTSYSYITNLKEKKVCASLIVLGPLYTADTAKTAGSKQG